jgi:hypothetical protein
MVEVFFFNGNCLCHPSVLIRSNSYQRLGLYDPLMRQLPDLDMWVRLCSGDDIFIHSEPLLQFRLRSGNANASADVSSNRQRASYELAKILERYSRVPLSDQLPQIFPGLFTDCETDTQRLLRLTELAMDVQSSAHQLFGLDCLRGLTKTSEVSSDQAGVRLLELALRANPFSPALPYLRIFHRTAGRPFTAEHSQSVGLSASRMDAQRISILIPADCIQLRIDPAEQIAIVHIFHLSITDADGVDVWNFERAPERTEIQNAKKLSKSEQPFRMLALSNNPQIILPEILTPEGWHLNLSLSVDSNIAPDLQKLSLETDDEARRIKTLRGTIREWKGVINSVGSWFKGLFRHWIP